MAGRMDEIMDCFVNPTKSKILLGIEMSGQATARQLLEQYPLIPQATMYRALNKLTELEILKVAQEIKRRGTVEKVYIVNKETDLMDSARIVQENDGEGYLRLFMTYTKSLMAAFRDYAKRPDINIAGDGTGFTAGPICVTPEELQELGQKMAELARPYGENSPAEKRKNHTLAIIITPPTD